MRAYNAAKFSVVGYPDGLQEALAGGNIGAYGLCPALVKTAIHLSTLPQPLGVPPLVPRIVVS